MIYVLPYPPLDWRITPEDENRSNLFDYSLNRRTELCWFFNLDIFCPVVRRVLLPRTLSSFSTRVATGIRKIMSQKSNVTSLLFESVTDLQRGPTTFSSPTLLRFRLKRTVSWLLLSVYTYLSMPLEVFQGKHRCRLMTRRVRSLI